MDANTNLPTGLLDVGHQCSAQHCSLVDFLPLKCQHCELKFCGEHFLPASHDCAKYDELKHNRVAPSCPLCNTPVTIPAGQDPNVRMDRHLTSECAVVTGKVKESTQPHCANKRCNQLLIAPIKCPTCHQQFCPQHRFPTDHVCVTAKAKAQQKVSTTGTSRANTKGQDLVTEMSSKSNAAFAAFKRSIPTGKGTPSSSTVQSPRPVQEPTSSTSKTTLNPLSKTDRRIKEERRSRQKAMEERAKKGLLSEEEKAILAAEKAESKDGDCLIM